MTTFEGILLGLAYVALGVALLVVAKLVRDLVTPYKLDEELTTKDNPALGLSLAGYFLGVVIIFLGAAIGPEPDEAPSWTELLFTFGIVGAYALGGIALLNIGVVILDRLVLSSFSIQKEIIEDRNLGTGAVVFGTYIATALVVAGSVYGQGVGPWWMGPVSTIVFFVLGQLALVLFGMLYRWITTYDLHGEIERDNVAAGVAFGLSIIAIGIVLLRATGQDFAQVEAAVAEAKEAQIVEVARAGEDIGRFVDESGAIEVTPSDRWGYALIDFGYYALGGFIVIALLRRVTDALLLPGSTIHEEIAGDKNVAAALIEGVVAIGVASTVYFMI